MPISKYTRRELKDDRFITGCIICSANCKKIDNKRCQICNCCRVSPSRILKSLSNVKISTQSYETDIHKAIKDQFDKEKISYFHEYRYAKRTRFDFWINGLVVEVKKRRPTKSSLISQLTRYASFDRVQTIIVVLEKSIDLPKKINNSFIYVHSLNTNWGIAI